MRILVVLLLCGVALASQEAALGQERGSSQYGDQFPDAPEPVIKDAAGNLVHDKSGDPLKWYQHTFTKPWLVAHGVLAASVVFDAEISHQGVAHHNCVEQNMEIPRHPSRADLYQESAIPVAIMTAFDLLVQSRHLPKGWAWMGYMGAGYGSYVHFKGGTSWLTGCW